MTKRNKPTRAELIEAGAALQREGRGGGFADGALARSLYGEACEIVDSGVWYFNACAIAAQLAAEKAGLA